MQADEPSVTRAQRRPGPQREREGGKDEHDIKRLAIDVAADRQCARKIDEIGQKTDRDYEFKGGERIGDMHETDETEIEQLAEIGSSHRMHWILEAMERRGQGAQPISSPDRREIERNERDVDCSKPGR